MLKQVTEQPAKQRVGWIDLAKGAAILLVLWGHAMRDPMRVENWALDYSYRVIYTFHMAFFFWLSGYVYRMTKGEPTLAAVRLFLKKKLKKQLLPWLAYSLCCYAAFAVALRIPAAASILASAGYGGGVSLPFFLLRCFQGDNIYAFHLWFIYTLFLIAALVAVAECASVRCGGTAAAARGGLFVLALLGVALVRMELLPLGGWAGLARYVCTYLPFYLLGMWMQGMHLARKWKLCWCFAGLTYIFIRASFFSGWAGDAIQAPSVPAELLIRYLSYLLLPGVMLVFCSLCRRLHAGAAAFLAALGRSSFTIYLLHQPFCCAFLGSALYTKLGLPALVVILICLAASIVLPLMVERVTARFPVHL